MATITPQVLSGRISFAVSSVASIIFFNFISFTSPLSYLLTIGFFLVLFLFTFFLLRYSIERFVQEKLSLIYQTIHQLKRNPSAAKEEESKSKDPITKVNEEVLDWHLDNQKEIDRLTVMEQYRRDFIGNVSHELKTPVFNIQGYLLTLLEGGLEDPSINRKFLERAEKSVEKLIKLLNELDMIIRLDTGGIQLNIQRINIVELTNEVVESVELKAEKKHIKLKVHRKNMEPLWVLGDEDKLSQVITNLIVNSIKYGNENGNTDISFHDMKNQILVEVKDNGLGVKEKDMPRVFDRFYRTDIARSHDPKGFGLGLSIVKHIIEAHNQTIHVNSTENKGSTFSFTLKKAGKR